MAIRVVLVDDEIQSLNNLERLLAVYPDVTIVKKIQVPLLATEAIIELNPDLIFLDVQMPGKDGFEIVRELHDQHYRPEIVFITAFDQYAIKAIRHAAFDFLLKPVNPSELSDVIKRFSETRDKNQDERYSSLVEKIPPYGKIKFNTGSGFILLHPDEIIYIEADWNYSEIWLEDGTHELVTTNLGSLEKILPRGYFYRVSRSKIINLSYLTKVNRKKRTVLLSKSGKEYVVKVPLLNIRKMERHLEGK